MRAEAQADAAAAAARPSFFFSFFFRERRAFALGSHFKPRKRAADVSLSSWEGFFFGVRRYRLRASEHDIRESSRLGGGG